MKRIIGNALIALVFLLGLGLICYPTVSNWYNERVGSYHIKTYQEAVDNTPYEEYEAMLAAARNYNSTLTFETSSYVSGEAENQTYIDALNVSNGMIGSLVIDKIDVSLPIYHGTNEGVLQSSIGHLEGSTLPTGETGEHTVLTGHTGLPSATLLTDLTQLTLGDTFTLLVLNQVYTYEVYEILVVEPHELDALVPIDGKNLATLITCTPYGVNSHRLFVQGELISTTVAGHAPTQNGQDTPATESTTPSDIPAWAEDFVMACATLTAEGMRNVKDWVNTTALMLQSIKSPPVWLVLPIFILLMLIIWPLFWKRHVTVLPTESEDDTPEHRPATPITPATQHYIPWAAKRPAPKHYAPHAPWRAGNKTAPKHAGARRSKTSPKH